MRKLVLKEVPYHTLIHNFRGSHTFSLLFQLRIAALKRTYAEVLVFTGNGLVMWKMKG